MDIKVGDIVEYKGNVVRLMATHSPSRMRLTNFGLVADEIFLLLFVIFPKMIKDNIYPNGAQNEKDV